MIPRKSAHMSSYTGLLLCGTCLAALPGTALAATYYVAPAGSDSNNGSATSPFQTIQHTIGLVQAGDTVNAEPGTYAGFVAGWDGPNQGAYSQISGTAGHPITIQADPAAAPGSVIINSRNSKTAVGIDLEPGCDYVTIKGFALTTGDGSITKEGIKATGNNDSIVNNTVTAVGGFGIFTDNANNALVQGNTVSNITGSGLDGHGMYISGTNSGTVVRGNAIYNNANTALHINGDVSEGGAGLVTNALIEDNAIYNNGPTQPGNGINADGLQNSVIQNNLIYGNSKEGIALYKIDASGGSKNNLIVNNTIIMPSAARAAIEIQNGSTGNTIFNNVLIGGSIGTYEISPNSLSGLVSDYNVVSNLFTNVDSSTGAGATYTFAQWQAVKGQDKHSILVPSSLSSLFANPSANNYQLAAGSPAMDRGVASLNGKAAPATDIAGTSRPQGAGFDIGAYEYAGGSPAPTPSPTPTPAPAPSPSPVVSAPTGAAITASTTNCQAPCADTFTGSAQGSNLGSVTYSWMFGDNATGSGASASHTYASAGSYTVTLVASNSAGSASAASTVTVTAPPPAPAPAPSPASQPPTVSASANVTSGNAPLAVKFSATASDPNSGGTITGYSWSFGDGATGTGKTPGHTYTKVGSYTATVTATDSSNLTAAASVAVKVTGIPPVADPTWSVANATRHKIQFAANASDPDTVSAQYPNGRIYYDWSFGDGATSTARNPAHAYAAAGTYAATLTVTDHSGLAVTKTLSVTVP